MATFRKYVEIEDPGIPADAPLMGVGSVVPSASGVPGPPTLGDGVAKGLIAAASRNPRIVAIMEDLGTPGLDWWKQNAPERLLEVGIAEQNGAVVAAGLAAEGFIPVIYGFVFAALGRAYNQIRQSILVDRFNVKLIAREGAWGEWGISHNTVEGIGMASVLPNLVILNPADGKEAEKAAEAMFDYIGPVFLRQEASPPPMKVFGDDYPFEIGKAFWVKEGKDATIIATGYMLTEAVRAIDILEKDGLDVGILNMGTIKPLDEDAIIQAAEKSGAIVTAENGTVMGGLGSMVAAVLSENHPTPLVRVGVEDEFSQSGLMSGGRDDLKDHFALGARDLAVAVKTCLAKQ